MIATLLDVASWILIVAGGFFCVLGGLGLLRLPDLFTRLHGGGLIDTLGASLLVLGMVLQAGFTLVTAKLILLLLFLFFTSPLASHAVASAAFHSNLKPKLDEDRTEGGGRR